MFSVIVDFKEHIDFVWVGVFFRDTGLNGSIWYAPEDLFRVD